MITRALMAILSLLVLGACTPITLDNEPAIDFDRYQAVYIEPLQGEGDRAEEVYLRTRLREDSGFRTVTTDPSVKVDAILIVRVEISDVGYDSDGDPDYEAVALYRLEHAITGELIDRGETNDSGSSYEDALREALDDVVLHYLRAYRL